MKDLPNRVLILSLSTYSSPFYDGKLRALAEHGVEIVAVAPQAPNLWGDAAEGRRGTGYRVETLPVAGSQLYATTYLAGLRELVRRDPPTLLHVEAEPWQGVAVQGLRCARRLDVPIGIQFAENGPRLRGVAGLVRMQAARATLRFCSYAVGWSEGSAAIARRLAPGIRVETFPGTGVPSAPPREGLEVGPWFGADSRDLPKIAFIGRFAREKGVLDFLQIADDLAQSIPLRVALVGDGPERNIVSRWSEGRAWAKLHGVLARPQAIEVMMCADALVCPSRTTRTASEQFGQAVVEAMAHGTPVFAYACGALGEVIGEGGVVVREGDSPGLVNALLGFFRGPTIDRTLKINKARLQGAQFSEKEIARRLVSLWSSLDLSRRSTEQMT